MDIEKRYKGLILVILSAITGASVVLGIAFNRALTAALASTAFSFLAIAFIEAYLRIQHNIDSRSMEVMETVDSSFSEIKTDKEEMMAGIKKLSGLDRLANDFFIQQKDILANISDYLEQNLKEMGRLRKEARQGVDDIRKEMDIRFMRSQINQEKIVMALEKNIIKRKR